MLQFKDTKTQSLFKKAMISLEGERQLGFAREVKHIADIKLYADSQDFTINFTDLQNALAKTF